MNETFNYKVSHLVRNLMTGGHKSQQRGAGSDFYKKSLFLSEPNLSAMDLKASLSDPFEQIHIRSYRQRSQIDVLLLIDGSSSMTLDKKPELIQQFFSHCQSSVNASGDDFSCYLFNDEINAITSEESLIDELINPALTINDASSFTSVNRILPKKPALIFLISDCHWPESNLHQLMSSLSAHIVVPIVLWQSAEYNNYPLWRFIELADLETGQPSLVFVTPKQKQNIKQAYQHRKQYLEHHFLRYQSRVFWLIDTFSTTQMSRYFSA
ncbi:MAG: hypothetical protein COA90_09320 [Gammaproteobacteria bacterium]|nr:MAG: hypothetical protein COA90_09320 [Gammaproteobacteria bacterium]